MENNTVSGNYDTAPVYTRAKRIFKVFQDQSSMDSHSSLESDSSLDSIMVELGKAMGMSLFLGNRKGQVIASAPQGSCGECPVSEEEGNVLHQAFLGSRLHPTGKCHFTEEECKFTVPTFTRTYHMRRGMNRTGYLLVTGNPQLSVDEEILLGEIAALLLNRLYSQLKDKEETDDLRKISGLKDALSRLSYTESVVSRLIIDQFKENDPLIINMDTAAKEVGVSVSVISRTLSRLQSAGVLDYRSLGPKGTLIRFIDEEMKAAWMEMLE